MTRAYFSRKQKTLLEKLRSEAPQLRALWKSADVSMEEFFRWLRQPSFAREVDKTLRRLRKIQSISADLTAFNITDKFAEQLAKPETSVEVLRKTWQADREARPKRKSKDKAAAAPATSFVHPDVPADEVATLEQELARA